MSCFGGGGGGGGKALASRRSASRAVGHAGVAARLVPCCEADLNLVSEIPRRTLYKLRRAKSEMGRDPRMRFEGASLMHTDDEANLYSRHIFALSLKLEASNNL